MARRVPGSTPTSKAHGHEQQRDSPTAWHVDYRSISDHHGHGDGKDDEVHFGASDACGHVWNCDAASFEATAVADRKAMGVDKMPAFVVSQELARCRVNNPPPLNVAPVGQTSGAVPDTEHRVCRF